MAAVVGQHELGPTIGRLRVESRPGSRSSTSFRMPRGRVYWLRTRLDTKVGGQDPLDPRDRQPRATTSSLAPTPRAGETSAATGTNSRSYSSHRVAEVRMASRLNDVDGTLQQRIIAAVHPSPQCEFGPSVTPQYHGHISPNVASRYAGQALARRFVEGSGRAVDRCGIWPDDGGHVLLVTGAVTGDCRGDVEQVSRRFSALPRPLVSRLLSNQHFAANVAL